MNDKKMYKDITRPMTKADKAKWIKALRSGDFNQTVGCLKNNKSYCCLGVANKVCNIKSSSASYLRIANIPDSRAFLPKSVQITLSTLNDELYFDFKQIADYIQQNIPAIDELT